MKTNAINNRESFLFKSLFGQTLDEMDAHKYEDFFNSLIHIECSNYGTFYDKTGTYFIIPAKNYIDCNIYRVVGSSHEDNKYCSMDYELVDRTDIFEVDESFNSEGIYLDKYIKNSKKLFVDKIFYLKKKYELNEVISTIQSHIYFKKDKEYALQEWEHDLEELKKIFYREDKVNYFD